MKKGFTLIELMVVIVIVVIITVTSIVGISASRSRRQVKTTAENLESFLTEARAEATSPDDTSFGVAKLRLEISTSGVRLYKVNASNSNLGEMSSPKFSIPGGISVTANGSMTHLTTGCFSANPCDYFSFNTSSSSTLSIGQITNTNPAAAASIGIRVSNGNDSYQVTDDVLTGLITITQL
ncbi:MAG: prepilin-type N-terminal cleavage/methylation domain-containing protein [Patescibacteria group bacterium]|jgi:prepilin-type N-terminal cleavage/methylation domain-containing protein